MDFGQLINALPLWLLFVLTLAISLLAVRAGTWLASFALRREVKEPEAPLGSLVGAVLGLLAFILVFTFGMTATRFDARKATGAGGIECRRDHLPAGRSAATTPAIGGPGVAARVRGCSAEG